MTTLAVPEIPDADNLTAALAYAKAGWYVLPVKRATGPQGKHPGSVVGKHWHRQSSRDPRVVTGWFAGTDHGVALHCGRSGAVVFDVDHPEKVPSVLAGALKDEAVPYQSSRPDVPGKGHYVFAMPEGRNFGNGTGRLGGGWGEVRGLNGVIIVAPTQHPEGGEYRWQRTGVVPALPDDIAAMLDDASPASDAASDATVKAFIEAHTAATRPELLKGWESALSKRFDAGNSRHDSTVTVTVGAMKECRAGYLSAGESLLALKRMFLEAVAKPPSSARQGASRTGTQAISEWRGIVAWAVGQALAADLDDVHARVSDKMPDTGNSATQFDDNDDDETRTGYTIEWRTATEVVDSVPEWIWHYDHGGRIMRNTLCLFAGRPAAGKSTAARYFASAFTLGTVTGCFEGQPQNVAYLAGEESIEHMVKPSLRAHGADMSRIYFPKVKLDGDEVALQSLRDWQLLLEDLKAKHITVVIVDPIMSTISGKADVHRSNETRVHVDPWVHIAEGIGGLVVGIVHLTKSFGSDVLAAINGSSAFGEVARSVIAFAWDQSTDDRVLSQEKNSAGRQDLALTYTIGPTRVTTDDGESTEVAQFALGGPSTVRVADILRGTDAKEKLGPLALEIYEAMREIGEPCGPSEISERVEGLDNDMAGKYLRRLTTHELVVKVGRGKFDLPSNVKRKG